MRTITGLYDNYDDAREAVKGLEKAGVPSDDISIVTNQAGGVDIEGQGTYTEEGAGTGAGIGAVAGGAGGLLTGLGLMAIPGVGPVVATGWLAATAAGAVAGAVAGGAVGGIVGAMIKEGVPENEANFYAEGIRRGGSVVTAKVEESKVADEQGNDLCCLRGILRRLSEGVDKNLAAIAVAIPRNAGFLFPTLPYL